MYVGMDPNSPGGSVQAAQGYADAAQASLTAFLGTWYGVAESDPALDPNGNAPSDGDTYFNATTKVLMVREAGVWRQTRADYTTTSVATGTGTGDAIAADLVPGPSSYSNILGARIECPGANTLGAPQLNLNTLGNKGVCKGLGDNLLPGDIPGAGFIADFVFSVSLDKFVLLNPASDTVNAAAAASSASSAAASEAAASAYEQLVRQELGLIITPVDVASGQKMNLSAFGPANTGAHNANYTYATRIYIPEALTIDAIVVNVASSGAGNIIGGIYSETLVGGYTVPGNRLAVSSVVSMVSTGEKVLPCSYTFSPGWYWVVTNTSASPIITFGSCGWTYEANPAAGARGFSASDFSSVVNTIVACYASYAYTGSLPSVFGTATGLTARASGATYPLTMLRKA